MAASAQPGGTAPPLSPEEIARLTLVGRWLPSGMIDTSTRFRVGASCLFAFTGIGHFLYTTAMTEMLPPFVSFRQKIIYVSGVLELLGALGIWVTKVRRLTGLALILMLIAVLPSNVYAAFNYVEFGGHYFGPLYLLVRTPFQFVLMWWVYKGAVEQETVKSKSLEQPHYMV